MSRALFMVAATDKLQQIFVAVAEYSVDLCLFAVAHGKDDVTLFSVQFTEHRPVTSGAICLFHSYPLFYPAVMAALLTCLTQ
jgi:hypothetical protein